MPNRQRSSGAALEQLGAMLSHVIIELHLLTFQHGNLGNVPARSDQECKACARTTAAGWVLLTKKCHKRTVWSSEHVTKACLASSCFATSFDVHYLKGSTNSAQCRLMQLAIRFAALRRARSPGSIPHTCQMALTWKSTGCSSLVPASPTSTNAHWCLHMCLKGICSALATDC